MELTVSTYSLGDLGRALIAFLRLLDFALLCQLLHDGCGVGDDNDSVVDDCEDPVVEDCEESLVDDDDDCDKGGSYVVLFFYGMMPWQISVFVAVLNF